MTQTADPTVATTADQTDDLLAPAKVSFATFITAYAAANQATASIIAAQQEVIAAQTDLSAAQHAKSAADLTVARSFAKVEADLKALGIVAPAPEDVTPTTPDTSGDTVVVTDGTTGQPVVVATEQSPLPTGSPVPVVTVPATGDDTTPVTDAPPATDAPVSTDPNAQPAATDAPAPAVADPAALAAAPASA